MATTTRHATIDTTPTTGSRLLLATAICIAACSGCTSVIGSAYLREAWLDAVEHAAEPTPRRRNLDKSPAGDAEESARSTDDAGSLSADDEAANDEAVEAAAPWSPATLDEAVAEADRALAGSGGLTQAARGTLIAMLEETPRQDWPVVVEEFTAALASAQVAGGMSAQAAARAAVPAVDASPAAEPVAPLPPTAAVVPSVPAPARDPVAAPEPARPLAQAESAEPAFAIRNACFASRVKAWGVVDRFETAEFAPGQELIVYFELDQLSARESADGHTTRIDTKLRLVDAEGRRMHDWAFEPLEETCGSRRHDYFARYLLALPESLPSGAARLEIVVSDQVAGRTALATLPLDVVRR